MKEIGPRFEMRFVRGLIVALHQSELSCLRLVVFAYISHALKNSTCRSLYSNGSLYQIKLGTVDQTEAENEWVLRPYQNTAKKRKELG